MKPLLLLDVDGVLNPDNKHRPGFEPHRVADETGRVWDVALSRAHGRVLSRLADTFDLAWATTWWRVANERLSPLIGLPTDLPAVRLPNRGRDDPFRVEGDALWKTPHVRRFAAGRPLAWFDDDVREKADTAALTGTFEHGSIYSDTQPVPAACVIKVASKWGLERRDIDRAVAWAETVSRYDFGLD